MWHKKRVQIQTRVENASQTQVADAETQGSTGRWRHVHMLQQQSSTDTEEHVLNALEREAHKGGDNATHLIHIEEKWSTQEGQEEKMDRLEIIQ